MSLSIETLDHQIGSFQQALNSRMTDLVKAIEGVERNLGRIAGAIAAALESIAKGI